MALCDCIQLLQGCIPQNSGPPGWAIGIGIFGIVIVPALGGVLVGIGLSTADNFLFLSIPAIIAGVITFYLASTKLVLLQIK